MHGRHESSQREGYEGSFDEVAKHYFRVSLFSGLK